MCALKMGCMKRESVQSTSLKSVGYDPESKTLEVEFHDGDVYQYFNVPSIVHRDLLNASSIGQYFAFFIKESFRFRKLAG
jgi:hypothetical protein